MLILTVASPTQHYPLAPPTSPTMLTLPHGLGHHHLLLPGSQRAGLLLPCSLCQSNLPGTAPMSHPPPTALQHPSPRLSACGQDPGSGESALTPEHCRGRGLECHWKSLGLKCRAPRARIQVLTSLPHTCLTLGKTKTQRLGSSVPGDGARCHHQPVTRGHIAYLLASCWPPLTFGAQRTQESSGGLFNYLLGRWQ